MTAPAFSAYGAEDDEDAEETAVSAQGAASQSGDKAEKKAKAYRYMQLNLLQWENTSSEVVTKTAKTEKAPSKSTSWGFDQSDTLEFGLYGRNAFINAGVGNPTDYNLAIGWRNAMLEAGIELARSSTDTESTSFVNGAEIKTTTESVRGEYGIVAAFVMGDNDYTAKLRAHFGLTSEDSERDDTQLKAKTADKSGTYFGLGAEYARKVNWFGPKIRLVSGLDYRYEKETDKNPVDGTYRDTGETVTTSHVWAVNLLGIRMHF